MLDSNLTMAQAQNIAITQGKKIRHRYFLDTEFIYCKETVWYNEEGYVMPNEWWQKMDRNWDTGWSVVD